MQNVARILLSSLSGLTLLGAPAGLVPGKPGGAGQGSVLQVSICLPSGPATQSCGPHLFGKAWPDQQITLAGKVTVQGLKINCPPVCTNGVAKGKTVAITAVAGRHGYDKYLFSGWSDGPCKDQSPAAPTARATCTLRIDGSTLNVKVPSLFLATG